MVDKENLARIGGDSLNEGHECEIVIRSSVVRIFHLLHSQDQRDQKLG